MSTLQSGPKLNWTRDNQMYERYRIWKKKVEFIFCSALADATPMQLVSYLKYWMGDQGIPLIEKWESTGKARLLQCRRNSQLQKVVEEEFFRVDTRSRHTGIF